MGRYKEIDTDIMDFMSKGFDDNAIAEFIEEKYPGVTKKEVLMALKDKTTK